MSLTAGRTVRLTALALATGTLVATAATGAEAASSHTQRPDASLLSYAGNTSSSVVSLQLNLPAAVASTLSPVLGQLGVANGTLDLSLLDQVGALQHDATGAVGDVATSTSQLAGGALFAKGGLLAGVNQVVTSTLADATGKGGSYTAHTANALGLPASVLDLLKVGLPDLNVTSAANTLSTNGNSVVAGLDLGQLSSLLPAGTLDALTSALNDLAGTAATGVSSTTTTVVTALNGILGQLQSATGGAVDLTGVTTQLQTIIGGLTSQIPSILGNLEAGKILTLSGLTTTHSLTTVGDAEVSTVGNQLASLDVLGGLVKVTGFANSLTTQAGGAAGSGKVVAQPNLATAQVGNSALTAVLGQVSSLQGDIPDLVKALPAGSTLIAQLTGQGGLLSQLTDLSTTLDNLLNLAGVSIGVDKVTQNQVAADGSSAKAALSGLSITVDPPLLSSLAVRGSAVAAPGDPLLGINIGGLQANSAAAAVVPARNVVTTTPTSPGQPKLAFTGADLPLTAGIATVLLAGGAALVIRRRRTAEEI